VDAILFQAELSKFCWSGGRLYAHEIVVFYPHSTINFLLFDQGSAIFDFKHLLDTGTILWIVVWILFSSGRSSIS
jgi:hypothetical protein